jgi:hypothetical protein
MIRTKAILGEARKSELGVGRNWVDLGQLDDNFRR